MTDTIRHWSDDPYWTDALERFYALHNAQETVTLDLASLESTVFDESGPAYSLMSAMCSVKCHEGHDGFRGAPRLTLGLIALLAEAHPLPGSAIQTPGLDFASARMTFVSALAWRCIAELFRRYGSRHRLTIPQAHPGSSLRGQLVIIADGGIGPGQPALAFNLGGAAGSYEVIRRVDAVPVGERHPARGMFATGMLEPEPENVVAAIAHCWGLPAATGSLPSTDKASITPRVIAGLLERKVSEPRVWRTTSAHADSSAVGPMLSNWHEVFGDAKHDDGSRLSRYVLLHQADDDEMVRERDGIQGVAWCFDLSTAIAVSLSASAAGVRLDLVAEYQRCGRHLPGLLRRLEADADALADFAA